MAFSAVAARGGAVSTVTHASLSTAPGVTLAVGKIVFVSCVSDNLATANGSSTNHLVTDARGNTWTKVFEETDSDGAAADGSCVSLWVTKVTTQIESTDLFTNTYQGGSVDAGIIAPVEATVGAGNTVNWETPALTHSDSGTDISATLSGLPNREYLFYGFHGAEGNDTVKTAIANYTEQLDSRSGTNSVTDVHIHIGTRILTGTGDTWTSSATTFTNGIQSLTGFYEVSGATPLTGSLFTKAPTFFTGVVTPGAVTVTGSLFTKAPTFFTGTVLATQSLTGVLFVKAPTFFVGVVGQRLSGVLFTKAPTFPQGAVTSTYALTGTLFVKAPTFFTGSVAATYTLNGVLFQKAPTFPTGVVTAGAGALSGVLFVKAPTFPQGVVTAGAVNLTGVLFQKAPTFPTGTVTAGTVTLTGSLFVKAPTFPTGTIGQAGTLFGNLFTKAPTFFTGSLTQGAPSFWQPDPAGWTANPAGFVRVGRYGPSPWGAELSGQRFEKAPTFPVGAVS